MIHIHILVFLLNFVNIQKRISILNKKLYFEEFITGNITLQNFPNNGKILSNNSYSWSELNISNNNIFDLKNTKYVSIINITKPINANFEDCKIKFIKTCSIENCDCIYISGEEFCEKCQDGYDLLKNDDLIK